MGTLNARRLRLVFDTNQIVGAGSRWLVPGAPQLAGPNRHLRLLLLTLREHTGLYCDEILDEYLTTLLERRHPSDRARMLVALIRGAFAEVRLATTTAPVPPRDPDDEVFLLCAIDGDADFLVSEDRDLLDLCAAYSRPVIASCSRVLEDLRDRAGSDRE